MTDRDELVRRFASLQTLVDLKASSAQQQGPTEEGHVEANAAAYRVYCHAVDHKKHVAWRDVQECIKAYNAVLRMAGK